MPYPRNIELTEDQENRLKIYLDTILTDSDSERQAWIEDLIGWQKDYWATAQGVRDFPFRNASGIVIPLTAIVFETVHARTMQKAFGLDQTVAGRAINPEWAEIADPYIRYFNHELKHQIKFKDKIESAIIEVEKLGTGSGCSYYENQVKYCIREINGEETLFPVTTKRGVCVHSIPISRLLFPFSASTVEDSPWVGEEHVETPYVVKTLENGGIFNEGTYDTLKFFYTNVLPITGGYKYQQSQEELERRTPTQFADRISWSEIWLAFELNEGEPEVEMVVHYHRLSRLLMSVRHNWNHDLRRKHRIGKYFPIEHRINGLGIAKQNEQFQLEVTAQHRQRLDNATLANMRMIKVSKMSGYGPNEPVFPGKMWFLDDMSHVETLQLGEIYPSSYNNEHQTLIYSQQRTGVNEVNLGMPQAGTPGTATSDLARIQEGAMKFDYTYGNTKKFLDDLLLDIACDLHQFGPSVVEYWDNIEGGQLARQILTLPPHLVRDGLIIELASAGQKNNKILDRQNWDQVTQRLVTYFQSLIQLAQIVGDPAQAKMIATRGLASSTEAMKQYLQTYEIPNINRIIIEEFLAYATTQSGGAGGISPPQQTGQLGNFAETLKLLAAGGGQ